MAYTEAEWNTVLSFLNAEAIKAPPDGIGKTIETTEEFVGMLRTTEAIKPQIVNDSAGKNRREFAALQDHQQELTQTQTDLKDQIDKHPGNPNPPRPTPVTP